MLIRPFHAQDASFIKEILYEALFVPPGNNPFTEEILESPEIKKYWKGFGNVADDLGFILEQHSKGVGAIWSRNFCSPQIGYGYISDEIAELSIAIREKHRNKGWGSKLIDTLESELKLTGVLGLSLSVDSRNPSHRLYTRKGYTLHQRKAHSCTLVKYF